MTRTLARDISTAVQPAAQPPPARLGSLDAYRGLIMLVLVCEGFHLHQTAQNFSGSRAWQVVGRQFEHTDWTGCTFWDLVLPSFMFMVGVSMPFSYSRRRSIGHSDTRMLGHAVWRSAVLIALGAFLFHMTVPPISGLMNVLAQIGLGYTFAFLLWGRPAWVQILTATVILGAIWAAYIFYPTPGIDLTTGSPQLLWWPAEPARWAQEHLAGVDPQWHANANLGTAVDTWLYSQVLDGGDGFRPGLGGYQVLGFVPEIAVMIAGLMAGQLLLTGKRSGGRAVAILTAAGLVGLVAGLLLHLTGTCPMIKKIFTPSFALFSMGWCLLFLAALYALVDVLAWRRWTWPLVVLGVNSIAAYVMYMLMRPFFAEALRRYLGGDLFDRWGGPYAPTIEALMVGFIIWLICYGLYRKRIFIRI